MCGRKSEFNSFWELDIEDSQSLLKLKHKISNHHSKLRLVVNATGRLHSDSLQPEKRLQHLDKKNMMESCLLYTSPSPRDKRQSRMPSSA